MFYVLVVAHFVSDFWLQGRKMAGRKAGDNIWLLIHAGIVFGTLTAAAILSGLPVEISIAFSLINSGTHAIIDKSLWGMYRKYYRSKPANFKYWENKLFYDVIGLDQVLHIGILYLTWTIMK